MMTLAERFEAKWTPEPNSGCWLWTASLAAQTGYGQLASPPTIPRKRPLAAHRFSFELYIGPIPAGMYVCHRCDVRHCVNPDHLFLGTPSDNARDMVKKGRDYRGQVLRGESVGTSKLTETAVAEILIRCARGERQRDIAKEFDVTQSAISLVFRGKSWKYLAAIKRDLTDPEKARFIAPNTLARSTLESELRLRGLPT